MGYLKTLEEAKGLLADNQEFTTGTLSAHLEFGRGYVVRSYGVVIAMRTPELTLGLVLPTAYDYSKTTSKHANIVKKAWGLN
jgi:hypothetical protein